MITILDNIILAVLDYIEHLLVYAILFLANPVGFAIVVSLVSIIEYLILESIIKDFITLTSHIIKNHKRRDSLLTASQPKMPPEIFKNKKTRVRGISNKTGVSILPARKLASGLVE